MGTKPHRVYAGNRFRFRTFFTGLAVGLLGALTACTGKDGASSEASPAAIDYGPCRTGDPRLERHGTSCMCCHEGTFTVAGSVARDAGVAWILVTDRDGRHLQMAVNPHDNFFRHRQLLPPLTATIVFEDGEVRTMPEPAPHGSCNGCHGETAKPLGQR